MNPIAILAFILSAVLVTFALVYGWELAVTGYEAVRAYFKHKREAKARASVLTAIDSLDRIEQEIAERGLGDPTAFTPDDVCDLDCVEGGNICSAFTDCKNRYAQDRAQFLTPEPERPPASPIEKQKFFIIWNPDHHAPPRVKFSTVKEARKAARLMAKPFAPHTFYVCEVESYSTANNPAGKATTRRLK